MIEPTDRTEKYGALFNVPQLKSSEIVQLGRGSLIADRQYAFGKDLLVHHLAASPRFAVTQYGDSDWVGLLLPVSRTGLQTVNGADVSQWQSYFLDGSEVYTSLAEERDNYTIAIRRRRLRETCAAFLGVDEAGIDLSGRPLDIGRALSLRLRKLAAITIAVARPLQPGSPRAIIPSAMESDVVFEVARSLIPMIGSSSERSVHDQSTTRIVSLAREVLENAPHASPGLAEMCAASGVGLTRLHQAFVHHFGVSAGRYLLNYRLTRAREALLNSATPRRAVKDIALSYGFMSSGRFSQQYRRVFGENPSITLKRSQATE